MADFYWTQTPKWGTCLTCGASYDPDGFVDLIADTNIVREGYEMVGTVDVMLCAKCITTASNLVGCFPKKDYFELREFAQKIEDKYEKTADEVAAWQQRYENLVEILSLIQLNSGKLEDNASGDNSPEFGAGGGPSPDLRVQEGGSIPSKGNGKAKNRSRS